MEKPAIAERSHNSRMDCSLTKNISGIEQLHWREGLKVIPKELDAEKLEDMLDDIKLEDFAAQGFNIDAKLLKDIQDEKYNLYVVGDGKYKLARGTPGDPDFLIAGDKNGNEIILDALKFYGFGQ